MNNQPPSESKKSGRAGYAALVGWPNVGKSTLFNRLLGVKLAIISSKPQTTRDSLQGVLNAPEGQVVLLDTPGWLQPMDLFQKRMRSRIMRAIHDDADVLIWVRDASPFREEEVAFGLKLIATKKPVIVAINKVETIGKESLSVLQKKISASLDMSTVTLFPISALNGEGTLALRAAILKHLPEGSPFYPPDQLTDQWERSFVEELIREKIFENFRDEVPHAAYVRVTAFTEKPNHKDVIQAEILVETEGQKQILIGTRGEAVKALGQAARAEIEEQLGRSVFLELVVKIQKNWRKDANFMASLAHPED